MIKRKKSLLLVLMFFAATSLYSQGSKAEYEALYIKNFLRYVEFVGNGREITVGVMGNSPILAELQKLVIPNGELKVKKVSNQDELSKCQIVYVSRSSYKNLSLIKNYGMQKFLIISEDQKIIRDGADISFYLDNNKLRFYINKESIFSKNTVKVSSALYSLGQEI